MDIISISPASFKLTYTVIYGIIPALLVAAGRLPAASKGNDVKIVGSAATVNGAA